MRVVILDAQGGGMGRTLVELMKQALPNLPLVAVGTNAMATSAMLKAGADQVATGENAICYNATHADLLLAPIGMTLCDAMLGEVSARMACAVGSSPAWKIFIPSTTCHTQVAGTGALNLRDTLRDAVEKATAYVAAHPEK